MDKTLDEKLVKTFPNLYKDRNGNMMETCMCWGFPGDGWFQLIWDLSEKLEKMILEMKTQHPEMKYSPRAVQVKEKYGTLRFYMSSETDEMSKAISVAEDISEKTCESCGKEGILFSEGWCKVRCVDCVSKEDLFNSYKLLSGQYLELWKNHQKSLSELEAEFGDG